jgi:hypothetical protein
MKVKPLAEIVRFEADNGAALRKTEKTGAGRERFFTDELPPEDPDLAADLRVTCIEYLHACAAVDQKKFFASDQKRNPQIVLDLF